MIETHVLIIIVVCQYVLYWQVLLTEVKFLVQGPESRNIRAPTQTCLMEYSCVCLFHLETCNSCSEVEVLLHVKY